MIIEVKHLMEDLPKLYAATVDVTDPPLDDDAPGAIPAELRRWLVRLRLLEGVPFANLVADTELLPEESIRWFYLDRRWTDAIVQGALSAGTVNSDDRVQLTAQYDAVRDELDVEERNARREPGSPRFAGSVEAVSGFILRSRAVSGWPGLHVRAFSVDPAEADDATYPEVDPRRMRLLRMERLAPAVLLVLFDGVPAVVHIEEPRQGVQFGFDVTPSGSQLTATFQPRDRNTFEDLKPLATQRVTVPFRADGAAGVVDIQAIEKELALPKHPNTGAGDGLDSAEYALQLIRFPWRQVFGDAETQPGNVPIGTVFQPAISYAAHVTKTFVSMKNPG
ncbi:hypothetical protein JNB_12743 [Janibacter sp. HTCC2649]|uniref:hypothetical protein n=1 Tax=Janibacter sp. HTCC2649 TaxID=313589 RepID=UPI000067182A|nr:hypothetical protein [Janibacter sp. HTCC2649]EAP97831.1 hypothetical protein JNB_12743 [Janibacter sp. HTCC2649]